MVTHSSVVEFSVVMREKWVRVRVSTLLRSFHCDTTLYSYVEASKMRSRCTMQSKCKSPLKNPYTVSNLKKNSLPLSNKDIVLSMCSTDSIVSSLSNDPNVKFLLQKFTELPVIFTWRRTTRPAADQWCFGPPTHWAGCEENVKAKMHAVTVWTFSSLKQRVPVPLCCACSQ